MKMIRTSLVLVVAMVAMTLQSAQAIDQPHMRDALAQLRAARAALAKAEHNKGGHRAKVAALVEQAIAELEAGMASVR